MGNRKMLTAPYDPDRKLVLYKKKKTIRLSLRSRLTFNLIYTYLFILWVLILGIFIEQSVFQNVQRLVVMRVKNKIYYRAKI